MPRRGLILFAHGARDARWAEPFRRLLARVRDRAPGQPAELAFLESMRPDLVEAATALAGQGVEAIRIVPLFFGRGGHLREDFPRQVEAARAAHPRIDFSVADAAGEDDGVQDALADYVLRDPG